MVQILTLSGKVNMRGNLRLIETGRTPPVWISNSNLGAVSGGSSFTLTLSAYLDSGSPVTSYRLTTGSSLPSGVTLSTDGVLSGTLPSMAPGDEASYTFSIDAVAPNNLYTSQIFTLTSAYNPPVWVTASGMIIDASPGTVVSYQLLTSDPDNNVDSFSIISGSLPPGVSINQYSGTISGTLPNVTTTTSYIFTARVADSFGNTNDREFSIRASVYGTQIVWVTADGELADAGLGQALRTKLTVLSQQVLI